MLGVDASFDQLTAAKIDLLKAANKEVFGQCLWTGRTRPQFALDNLRLAANAGLVLTGYGSVTSSGDGGWHAAQTRTGVPDDLWDALKLVPCDVELPHIPSKTIRTFVDAMTGYGQRRAIYTSAGQWLSSQGNDTSFTDCLLVLAVWDGNPTVGMRTPFGGWTDAHVVGVQYQEGTYVGGPRGIYADLDVYDATLLEGHMPTPEYDELRQLIGNTLAYAVDCRKATDAIATAFFDHVQQSGGDTTAVKAEVDAINAKLDAAAAALK